MRDHSIYIVVFIVECYNQPSAGIENKFEGVVFPLKYTFCQKCVITL